MDNRLATHKNINLLGLAYLAIIPVLAFVLSLIPLKTNAAVDLPFLTNTQAERVLAFGGFPDCGTTCSLSLVTLQKTYVDYNEHIEKDDLRVVFVNIKLNTPAEITRKYAQSFHPDFDGYSTKSDDASSLYKTLSLKTFSSKKDYTEHTGLIYLFENVNQQWRMTRVFDSNVDQQRLLNHLLEKYI